MGRTSSTELTIVVVSALPQRAILILHRALHNLPSLRNRSVEHCLGRHVMPSKTNPCLGPSRDRKLASFNAQLTDARLVCKGRPGGFAMDGGRPVPSPLCGPVTGNRR